MIHSLEDKNKKELIEIVKIQLEEYQKASKRIVELEEKNAVLKRDAEIMYKRLKEKLYE